MRLEELLAKAGQPVEYCSNPDCNQIITNHAREITEIFKLTPGQCLNCLKKERANRLNHQTTT